MPDNAPGRLADLDLSAVGNAARGSKDAMGGPKDLTSFSVKKGDDGGVLVSTQYERKAPAGRRPSSFMPGTDRKETPFSPDEGAAAMTHIQGLLGQMGVEAPSPEEPSEAPEEPTASPVVAPPLPARQPRPPLVAAAKGPRGGGIAMRGGGFGGY